MINASALQLMLTRGQVEDLLARIQKTSNMRWAFEDDATETPRA